MFSPHLKVALHVQVGMVVVGNPRCCVCFCDACLDQGWLPGSPHGHGEPCWVNSWVGNRSAERLVAPLPDHPPRSPLGSGDGFSSDLPHPPLLTSVAKRALVVFSSGSSILGRTSLCKGLNGHKIGPAQLNPEQALVLGGRQKPGGALRWGKT